MKEMFTPDMRLSEMIDMDYTLVQVVSRMGIDLRHTPLKVSDACALAGIDPATFILISGVYSFPEYVPKCILPDSFFHMKMSYRMLPIIDNSLFLTIFWISSNRCINCPFIMGNMAMN